jgi:hypothetical protein
MGKSNRETRRWRSCGDALRGKVNVGVFRNKKREIAENESAGSRSFFTLGTMFDDFEFLEAVWFLLQQLEG